MYTSVSHKHQIGDYQVYETISRTINLTNIISILVHYCIKTYFQLWSHSSPTPFLMKRKSCRFIILLLRYRCRVIFRRPKIGRVILHRPFRIALYSGTPYLPSRAQIFPHDLKSAPRPLFSPPGLKSAISISGRLEIPPCVLQDIGPLGPLPCSLFTSSLDHSKQGIGYR